VDALPTIVKEGSLFKAAAAAVVAIGIGIFVLLCCWGTSLFWVDTGTSEKLDALAKQTVALSGAIKDGRTAASIDAVGAKIDALGRKLDSYSEKINVLGRGIDRLANDIASIEQKMATFDLRLSDIKIGKYSPGEYRTSTGNVISREVTVFNSIKLDEGFVMTGWKYKDGAATEPYDQFCYYTVQAGDSGVDFKIDLFTGGKRIFNDAVSKVPNYEEAFGKCQWYGGRMII
jgi:hypothetical protein